MGISSVTRGTGRRATGYARGRRPRIRNRPRAIPGRMRTGESRERIVR